MSPPTEEYYYERTAFDRQSRSRPFQPISAKSCVPVGHSLADHLLTWPFSGHIRGQVVACFDLLRGHPKWLGVGLPLLPPEFDLSLKERYGIEVRQTGCMRDPTLDAYVAGYNEIIVTVAKHKFGAGIFKKAAGEAER